MSDADLMRKYCISQKGLQSLFNKLIKANLISLVNLDSRGIDLDGTVGLTPHTFPEEPPLPQEPKSAESLLQWRCPSCRAPQSKAYHVCPQCGVIVSKFQNKQSREEARRREEQEQADRENLLLEAGDANEEAVTDLLDRGTPVDASDPTTGRTPLIEAAANGHWKVVELLLARGADSTLTDTKGRSALSEAKRKKHPEIVTLLNHLVPHEDRPLEAEPPEHRSGITKENIKKSAVGIGLRVGSFLAGAGQSLQARSNRDHPAKVDSVKNKGQIDEAVHTNQQAPLPEAVTGIAEDPELLSKLQKLQEAFDAGILDQSEFLQKRCEVSIEAQLSLASDKLNQIHFFRNDARFPLRPN